MLIDRFDQLMTEEDSFDLCDGIFCFFADVFGNQLDAINEPEPSRTVTLVWQSSGLIKNGGFRYLFESVFNGDPGFKLSLEAYRRIGARQAYTAFSDALSEPSADTLEECNSLFYDCETEIENCLAGYIRENADAFRQLVPKGVL